MGRRQTLGQGSSQALLGLLRSISPGAIPDDGRRLNEDDIKRLSEKMSELLGQDAAEQSNQDVNERGELVDEEGLPIIDINESAEDAGGQGAMIAPIVQDQLVLFASLSEAQREHLRQERDRILDILEEEERLEEQQERERLLEEKGDFIRKKMEEAAKESDRRNAAKEMQKKMGKALLRNKPASEGNQPKKSVSFAAEPAQSAVEGGSPETWGDISLARLRPMDRPTLLSKMQDEKQPMKTKVVERKSVGRGSTEQPRLADSDDESGADAEGAKASQSDDKDGLPADQHPEVSASESDATNESLEDLDYAHHQREVALEYYAKRGIIGQVTAQALISHSHATDDEEEDIASDVGIIDSHSSKPPISRFKASKLTSTYNASIPQSTSLDGSVLSASSAKTLQRAIRMGRLDSNGQLVGSDSEGEAENETIQQALDLLSKGGDQNDRTVYSVPPPQQGDTDIVIDTVTLPALKKPKALKFKVDRSQAGLSKTGYNREESTSTPTVPTSYPTASVVMERRPPGATNANSPSFPPPVATSTQIQSPYGLQESMIVGSRSFRQPLQSHASTSVPIMIGSPSFAPPKGALPSLSTTNTSSPSPTMQKVPRRPFRPPAVLSSVVHEELVQPITERLQHVEPTEALKPKKISRFLAERT